MARPRKLQLKEVQAAAMDRRKGATWKTLAEKYKVSINTVRKALGEYSTEFTPINLFKRSELEERVIQTESEIEKIKQQLKKRFNLHI